MILKNGDRAVSNKIYKYFSQDMISVVFERDGYCGIKCSFPKEYNDPFELFLGIDIRLGPEALATYRELIDELPQYPTTCFSKSPVVPPMWAHYAQNHTGFVLEFDVDRIRECFSDTMLKEVNYRDEPDEAIAFSLDRVMATKKPRHVIWLQDTVIYHAYFSKYSMWSYEQEVRMVVDPEIVEIVNDNHRILFFPIECITAVVVGYNCSDILSRGAADIAEKYDLNWFESSIGKSMPLPFLRNRNGDAFIFSEDGIVEAESKCCECLQAFEGEGDICPWCEITNDQQMEAAQGNPLRMLDALGQLDKYYEGVRAIKKSARKRQG